MEGGGIEPTQPLILSQTQPEIDPAIHARLVSLLPATVPTADMRGDSLVVGRDPEASQVVVKDKRVSGRHVRIYRDAFAYYVEALGAGPTWHQGRQLTKGEVRTLSSGDSVSLLYNTSAIEPKERIADFLFQVIGPDRAHEDPTNVESRYQILKELGSGNFSKVLLGVDRRDARHKVAVKKICVEVFEKFRKKRGTKLTLKSESEVLRSLQHPNMVQLLDVFEREGELCLVMELCEGGDLLHNILEQGAFIEYHGRKLFKELMGAVRHLHDRNIVHRDLKPENVLLTCGLREKMVAKITDFGLAVQLGEEPLAEAPGAAAAAAAREQQAEAMQRLRARATMCRTFCGTPHYFAPEVILAGRAEQGARTSYGKEVDMWSMGVMLYIILSAVPPFDEESGDMEALYGRICKGEWEFDAEEFERVSAAAKELVSNLMRVSSRERLSAAQALRHRWFNMLLFPPAPAAAPSSDSTAADCQVPAKRRKTGELEESVNGSTALCCGTQSSSKENVPVNVLQL